MAYIGFVENWGREPWSGKDEPPVVYDLPMFNWASPQAAEDTQWLWDDGDGYGANERETWYGGGV